MRWLRRILAMGALAAVGGAGIVWPPAAVEASRLAPGMVPAQVWGAPVWPGGFGFGPDLSGPYAGGPAYPYYRYGAYYGSAYGPPYPSTPSYGAYYGSAAGAGYPSYTSAGGVAFGDTWGGYYPSVGRCVYSASAGYGGSWSDPQSYGYYAPYC